RLWAAGRTDRGQRSRFRGQGVGQGRPLRGLRHRRQPRLCQPRNRPRHRGVRRQRRPMLARSDGLEALSRDEAPDDHGRRRRLQWFTAAALEVGPPTTRGRNRSDHSGLPLSARDFEVEQDRASHVLPHHAELARDATPQPPHRHRTDRQHHDENRSQNPLRTRSQHLSKGHQGLGRGNGDPQHDPRLIPSRMELQHLAEVSRNEAIVFGHRLNSAAFSPDGKQVLTASSDNTARLWDAASGAALITLKGHDDRVNSAAFSPHGKQVLTASSDNTARLWDAASGAALVTFKGHEREVVSAAFSPDGKQVLTASWDNTARLWDAASGKAISVLTAHEDRVNSAAFSPDGTRVVTASFDRT